MATTPFLQLHHPQPLLEKKMCQPNKLPARYRPYSPALPTTAAPGGKKKLSYESKQRAGYPLQLRACYAYPSPGRAAYPPSTPRAKQQPLSGQAPYPPPGQPAPQAAPGQQPYQQSSPPPGPAAYPPPQPPGQAVNPTPGPYAAPGYYNYNYHGPPPAAYGPQGYSHYQGPPPATYPTQVVYYYPYPGPQPQPWGAFTAGVQAGAQAYPAIDSATGGGLFGKVWDNLNNGFPLWNDDV